MKKIQIAVFIFFSVCTFLQVYAENNFSKALRNCDNYTKEGVIPFNNQNFNISISLNKNMKGVCVYKEKIHQPIGYQLLTCNFSKGQLPHIADSMERYNQFFKKEIAQNNIFEAKMSTNGEVFKDYLANPAICNITYKKY